MTRNEPRTLADLDGIGKAMLGDFDKLGITSVAQLAQQKPRELYDRLSALTKCRQDPCVFDVFACAIAQARDPQLSANERKWWTWSRRRKAGQSTGTWDKF